MAREPIDTSKLRPIQLEGPGKEPRTRLELLELVNKLNIRSDNDDKYWTVTVMYNTVIYRYIADSDHVIMHAVYKGII